MMKSICTWRAAVTRPMIVYRITCNNGCSLAERSQNSFGPGVRLRKGQHGHEGADKGDRKLDPTFRLAPNSDGSIIDGYRYSV